MKKFVSLTVTLVVSLAVSLACLSGCNPDKVDADTTSLSIETFCFHQWKNATCIEPATCTLCGEIVGTALGHQWVAATYESPKTCSLCGETEGSVKSRTCLLCDTVIKREGRFYCNTHGCMNGDCPYPAKNIGCTWGLYCIYHSCQVPDCFGIPISNTGYCRTHS